VGIKILAPEGAEVSAKSCPEEFKTEAGALQFVWIGSDEGALGEYVTLSGVARASPPPTPAGGRLAMTRRPRVLAQR
jgi:hypothetical protein